MCVDPMNCQGQCPECTNPQPHAEWCDGNGYTECWDCGGEGGYHNCGDDCCPHVNPELETDCDTCGGNGRIECPACEVSRRAQADIDDAKADAASY